jgi:DNA repair protein RadD
MGATQDGPGISVQAVMAEANLTLIRSLLGEPVAALLDLLAGGTASATHLRQVAAATCDFEQLLADPDHRSILLDLLDEGKQRELVFRLGLPESKDPAQTLQSMTWTKEFLQQLFGFFGLVVDRSAIETSPPRRATTPGYGLFPHQRSAARRMTRVLAGGRRRGVLHLPTGVGKTRTAMSMICDHLRQHGPTVVVWLAHGRELLEQAALEFERAWASLGDREVTVARMFGSGPISLDGLQDGLVVLGVEKGAATARADMRFLDELGSRVTFTVFDEAHQAIAPTYRMIIDALTLRPDSSLLGLTATPGRTWADISADERLADFFGGQKVMLEIEGWANPVSALIEQRYLARPCFRTVAAESGLKLSETDRAALASTFDVPAHLLASLEEDVEWNLHVIRTVVDLVDRHNRILTFASSVKHCHLLSSVLASTGIDCDFVTAETPSRRRDQAISRFKSRRPKPMVLCNYGVLTTGFDAPAASAAVIARPTKSLVLYSQMVGRVIRGPLAGGTESCEIVTVVDPELPGFGDVAEAFTNWEDVWGTK